MSSDDTPRRPGPWDGPAPAAIPPAPPVEAALDRGQSPLWAVVSTLLLGGFVWWISGSWIVAVAVLFGLLVHEYGHVLAMNRLGMGPARIYIIPFLGGLAKGQRAPSSEWDGVKVSLAGPAFGLLAVIPFFGLYLATGQAEWLIGAFAIAVINLVNLAPAPPLDGSKALGPVLARIHPMVEKAAVAAVGAAVVIWGVLHGSYIFAGFLAIALVGHLMRGAWRAAGRRLSGREAAMSLGLFVLTAAACLGVCVAALLPIAGAPLDSLRLGAGFFGYEP